MFLQCSAPPLPLPSFPTRRSSDLGYIQSQKDMPRCVLHAVLRIHQCHDAISSARLFVQGLWQQWIVGKQVVIQVIFVLVGFLYRSEEHTSELQSRENLVCRLLLEK